MGDEFVRINENLFNGLLDPHIVKISRKSVRTHGSINLFKKTIRNYALGQFEDTELVNKYIARGTDGCKLLAALIAGNAGYCWSLDHETSDILENKRITGFFIAQKANNLNLFIFVKGNSSKPQRYTASLDEFTKIRQKRLN